MGAALTLKDQSSQNPAETEFPDLLSIRWGHVLKKTGVATMAGETLVEIELALI